MDANMSSCDCCELSVRGLRTSTIYDSFGFARGVRCRVCNDHQGVPLKKAQEHEYEVRARWGETCDELDAALNQADEYKRKMKAAYDSRANVLRQFEKLSRFHRATDHGCICGKRQCETLAIIDADWINDHITRMHSRDYG